jgi:sulfur carrier protein
MMVYVNERECSVRDNCNIDSLLDFIDLNERKGIAVAVNYEVISKDKWNNVYLSENDRIVIIKATKGG